MSEDDSRELDLQLTEVKQESNEEKMKKLLDKMNATLEKIKDRKKNTGT